MERDVYGQPGVAFSTASHSDTVRQLLLAEDAEFFAEAADAPKIPAKQAVELKWSAMFTASRA